MGRPIKPLGLHRKAISISLPLDVIGWLDRLVASKEKGTRSRTIEAMLRAAMLKGQTTFKTIITTWECSGCGWRWRTKDTSLEYVYCSKCNKQQDKQIDFKGQMIAGQEEEEE